MKDINKYINESIKANHPLCLYVENTVQSTETLLLSNRNVEKIINKIIDCGENPKKSWIDDSNIINFIITEGEHSSWQLSMNIQYNISDKKFTCYGYDDKIQNENEKNNKLIDWDKKTIHIYKGNTYTI